ncbi:uncharacterized protein LOC130386250 [Gadus chalcogrammus]|uniref:uncharacterized protein LOC130386250 n=1 Tax=Gadus chalcogrammus TaxID=1042646 RepID=UPI0024C23246|nr:uncharacterized protein LOC130386250 [Gadus chalcogrammus]
MAQSDAGDGTSDLRSTPPLSSVFVHSAISTDASDVSGTASGQRVVLSTMVNSNTLTSVFFRFCIGLVHTVLGGALTGQMVVVTAQILETVKVDGLLMEDLNNTLSNDTWAGLRATYLPTAVVQYNLIGSFLGLFLTEWAGKSTYSEFIKTVPERIPEDSKVNIEALNIAGSVCLMLICVLFAALGYTFKHFIRPNAKVVKFSASSFTLYCFIHIIGFRKRSNFEMKVFNVFCFLIFIIVITLIIMFNFRFLLLTNPLFFIIIIVAIFGKRYGFYFNPAPVPVMLMIGEVFALCGTNVLDQQKVESNTTALEGLFYGLWNNQLFTMSLAMSVFGSLQTGDAITISFAALGSGVAILSLIKGMITVLDPWPLLGVLTGVAAAAGLDLSVAGTAAGRYGWPGTVGAVLGAGVGAFLGSFSLGGVSSTFIALSTALIPAFNHPTFLFLFKDVFVTDSDQSESQATDNIPTAPDNPREESAPPQLKKKKRFYNS